MSRFAAQHLTSTAAAVFSWPMVSVPATVDLLAPALAGGPTASRGTTIITTVTTRLVRPVVFA